MNFCINFEIAKIQDTKITAYLYMKSPNLRAASYEGLTVCQLCWVE